MGKKLKFILLATMIFGSEVSCFTWAPNRLSRDYNIKGSDVEGVLRRCNFSADICRDKFGGVSDCDFILPANCLISKQGPLASDSLAKKIENSDLINVLESLECFLGGLFVASDKDKIINFIVPLLKPKLDPILNTKTINYIFSINSLSKNEEIIEKLRAVYILSKIRSGLLRDELFSKDKEFLECYLGCYAQKDQISSDCLAQCRELNPLASPSAKLAVKTALARSMKLR